PDAFDGNQALGRLLSRWTGKQFWNSCPLCVWFPSCLARHLIEGETNHLRLHDPQCVAFARMAAKEAAGEALPPSTFFTGLASSGRRVCAPGPMALPWYRRPLPRTGAHSDVVYSFLEAGLCSLSDPISAPGTAGRAGPARLPGAAQLQCRR